MERLTNWCLHFRLGRRLLSWHQCLDFARRGIAADCPFCVGEMERTRAEIAADLGYDPWAKAAGPIAERASDFRPCPGCASPRYCREIGCAAEQAELIERAAQQARERRTGLTRTPPRLPRLSDPETLRRFAREAERRGVKVKLEPSGLRELADRIEAAEAAALPAADGEPRPA